MENELSLLLNEIGKKDLKSYRPEKPNLFYMLGIEHNEVLICRLIAALIQPNGLHGLGTKPLEMFLQKIGVKHFGKLDKAEIVLEEKIDNDRRVDIVIYLEKKVIPIEVKIWAKDQESQLFDYYNYYENRHDDFGTYEIDKIYYLTPNGKPPTPESLNGLNLKLVVQISFNEQIQNFITELRKEISNKNEIGIIIDDFSDVIERMNKDMTNVDELKKCISDIDDDKLNALLMLLNYKDNLWDEIRYKFLKNSLEKETSYALDRYEKGDEFEKIDPHCKYVVKDRDEIIAYICIETNLYITKKADLISNKTGWEKYKNSKHNNYMWKYIKYDGNNSKWNLKDIDTTLNSKRKIEWSNYLEIEK
ncbi:MAG: PD-(D/E)XK nuclease family protein [Eubacterium sp.]|nr:PD-(D/E)XK nuclease family protein [Eubacterium sp.]